MNQACSSCSSSGGIFSASPRFIISSTCPFVVLEIFLVRFEAALEMTESTHSYISVVRQVWACPEREGHAVMSIPLTMNATADYV